MEKNGFTLVELLASILIIMILFIVTTPNLLRLIDNNKEFNKQMAKEQIIDAGKTYSSSFENDVLTSLFDVGDKRYVDTKVLINFGLVEQKIVDILEEDNVFVSYELLEDEEIKYDVEFDSSLVVENKPYILMIGDNPYYVALNSTFVDPGAVAYNQNGENISSKIVKSGSVNTSIPGEYLITYKVSDNNVESNLYTRSVFVLEVFLPEIVSATIFSDNELNNKYAKNGDTINLNLTFSREIKGNPTVLIGGRLATITGSGTTRTATYTIPIDSQHMIPGIVSVSVSNYKDIYGNKGLALSQVTDNKNVIYDRNPPIITYFFIGGENNPEFVTKRTTLNSSVSGAYQMCFSDTTSCDDWVSYAPSKEMEFSYGGGEKTIYAWYRDLVGNVTEMTSDSVKLQIISPVVVNALAGTMRYRDPTFASGTNSFSVYNNSGNGTVVHARVAMTTPVGSYAMRITTNGAASPGLGGFYQETMSQANRVYMHRIIARIPVGYTIERASNATGTGSTHTWITPQAGTGNWEEYIYITRAGSTGTFSTFGHVYLSGTAATSSSPVVWYVAYATIYDTQYWGRTGNIVFNTNHPDPDLHINGYGINTSSTTPPTFTTIANTKGFGMDIGNYTTNATYYIWLRDTEGNLSNKAVTLNRIDRTAPTCTSSGGSTTWVASRTITGTCSDTGGSGCVGNVTKAYSANTNITNGSPGTVYDNAGNSVTCPANQTVRVDVSTPVCTSSGGSTTWATSRTITGTCSGSYTTCANVSKAYTATTNTTTASPGQVCNSVKCTTCPANQTVKVDVTPPPAFTNNTVGRTTSSISISATGASDPHSGLSSSPYAFSNNGGSTYTAYQAGNSYNFTGLAGGTTYSMRIRVRDALGNVTIGGAWNVTTLLTRVSNYAVTTSQMYRSSAGNIYYDYPAEQIQGTYDGTLTNTRNTLFWFDHATIRSNLSGSTINGVRLRVQRLNTAHGNAGAGTVKIYTHNHASVPGSWYGSGIAHQASLALTAGQSAYVALPVAVGNGFRDNTIKGMAFWSASTHQWNEYVRCVKSSTLLEITYTK